MDLDEDWPPLPASDHPWSMYVVKAYNMVSSTVQHAIAALQLKDIDHIQLSYHEDAVLNRALPAVEALEASGEGLPRSWCVHCAISLANIVTALRRAHSQAVEFERDHVRIPEPVYKIRSGNRGRPSLQIDRSFLVEAMSSKRGISQSALSRSLGIHRSTLRSKLKEYGIERKHNPISDDGLDTLMRSFKKARPQSGRSYAYGFLHRSGLYIQQRRIRESLKRVDGVGTFLRNNKTIPRREYHVGRPNALWHIDGHHKLVRWGIVIHGIVDGYDRFNVGIRAHTNNRPKTVLCLFTGAVNEHGMPSRVRGDRGGENVDVAIYTIMRNGTGRASFMWGSSTHNTRIERMWVEVGTQFARSWRAFFTQLERLHKLDVNSSAHLWLLAFLFLDNINDDCARFREDWNAHPISGPNAGFRSPQDMRLLGQLQHGFEVRADECEGVHPSLINQYYGIERRSRRTESADDADIAEPNIMPEDSSSLPYPAHDTLFERRLDELPGPIAEELRANVRHAGAPVPRNACPFMSVQALERFRNTLQIVFQHDEDPDDFNIHLLTAQDYPASELLIYGRGGKKEIEIALPAPVWLPRARRWCQAASLLGVFADANLL